MLLLLHPAAASRPCDECRKWMYRDTKDALGYEKSLRGGKPVPRDPKVATPCGICPKKSPQQAHEFELSYKNSMTYALYHEVQATCGACLTDDMRDDPILRRNLGICNEIYRTFVASRGLQ